MGTSLAELNGRVYLELPIAAEYSTVDKVHNRVVQAHAGLAQHTRMSTRNVLLGSTAPFTMSETVYDIEPLIGKGVPIGAEILTTGEKPVWLPITIVNILNLPDYTNQGILAVAFYGTDPDNGPSESVMESSIVPNGEIRIRYDRDVERKLISELSVLPDHVADLIVKRAINSLIPTIKTKIVTESMNNSSLRAVTKELNTTLTEQYAQNRMEMEDTLIPQWQQYAFGSRQNERGSRKRTPSGRRLYGE